MNPESLAEVLRLHKRWLADDPAGKRAVLSRAVLTGADLSRAVLTDAVLRGADLTGAELRHCIPSACRRTGRAVRGLEWPIWISPDGQTIAIGCQTHPTEKWAEWGASSPEIAEMHSDAPALWAKHKQLIMEMTK